MKLGAWLTAGIVASAAVLTFSAEANAASTIKNPGDHVPYKWELEPHLNFGFWGGRFTKRHRNRYSRCCDVGAGFRASAVVMDPGFVPSINDNVAISFGVDVLDDHYWNDDYTVWSPVVLQWNFFLHEKWSVFGEPGIIISDSGFLRYVDVWPTLFLGGRFHFSESVALMLRGGTHYFGLGLSIFP